jgi:pimeloyl-ACP methyl ester carboxylesterase
MKASLLFAFALAACVPAFAAGAPAAGAPAATNRFAATIVPAERFEVGALLVERHGSAGRPLVLIPGLASGSWVWQDTVRAFSGQHAVYVVTLPGFDGRAPIPGNVMDAARTALRQLIVDRKLDKPVLAGHSLGGTLAFAVAQDAPDLVGGVVSVDGLPVMPGTENTQPAQRAELARQMKARIAPMDIAAFAGQQQRYMQTIGVLDMSKGQALAQLTAQSDPAAVARAMADDVALDLRPGLPRIAAPVLVVAPYFEPDASQRGITEAATSDYYRSLVEGSPKAEVVTIAPSRHFVMFDQPEKLAEALRQFLSKL